MKKCFKLGVLIITLSVFLSFFSWGEEFCVKSSSELQNALAEAASNDEDDIIKIARGTYIGNFIFDSSEGKNITMLGGYSSDCANRLLDPANTILDGNNLGRVLFLNNSSGGDIYVEGFKIRKGVTIDKGGGIYAASQSWDTAGDIAIAENIVLDNTATIGSGIYAFTSNEYVDEARFSSRITEKNLTFLKEDRLNSDEIWLETNSTGDITISNNKIKNNQGDGLHAVTNGELIGGFITIQNNLVVRNSGRGIVANSFAGDMKIDSNFISKNTSLTSGGGIFARSYYYLGTGGNITLVNNIITENSSVDGGGIYATTTGDQVAGYLDIINNTITENSCSNSGGGIYLDGRLDSVLNAYNNIVWGNTAPTGGDISLVFDSFGWTESNGYNNNYSIISGNWDHSGQNINIDPQFEDPGTENYHLQTTSPCVDKGKNEAPRLPDKDYDGEPRIFDGNQDNTSTVDIGADEFIGVPLQDLTIESSSGGTTNPVLGLHTYVQGTQVQISAIPEDQYRFHEWTGNIPAGKNQDNPLVITMGSDKSIKANFVRIIYPPSNVTGQKVMNRSLSQVEYINVLKWNANSNNQGLDISKYRIYLIEGANQSQVAELSTNIFEYWHRGVKKDGTYQYAIYAVSDANKEGDPIYITVQ